MKSDYTGLEIKDDNKVKVTFEEAKNDKDEDFTTNHADTYNCLLYTSKPEGVYQCSSSDRIDVSDHNECHVLLCSVFTKCDHLYRCLLYTSRCV